MENRCRLKDSSTTARIEATPVSYTLRTVFALLAIGFALTASAASLPHYRAVYATTYKGMSAEAEQTLQATTATQFVLSRNLKTMFVKLSERSEFSIGAGTLVSSRYTYNRSGLVKKKDIEQLFQWDKNNLQVTENGRVRQVAITPPLFDKLNYIEVLRWQLLNTKQLPKNLSVKFADRHHLKQYDFVVGNLEDIELPTGKVSAVRLERHVPEDNKHTLIWVAPSMDYMLVKLQQTDDGDRYELHLKKYEAR